VEGGEGVDEVKGVEEMEGVVGNQIKRMRNKKMVWNDESGK
jgi:hypothetical protein